MRRKDLKEKTHFGRMQAWTCLMCEVTHTICQEFLFGCFQSYMQIVCDLSSWLSKLNTQ